MRYVIDLLAFVVFAIIIEQCIQWMLSWYAKELHSPWTYLLGAGLFLLLYLPGMHGRFHKHKPQDNNDLFPGG